MKAAVKMKEDGYTIVEVLRGRKNGGMGRIQDGASK